MLWVKNKNKKTSYGVYLGKCNRDTEIQYLSMLPLCHLWLFIFTSVRAATEKRKKATSLFTFIGGCRDGYGVCFFSYSQHWCLCFGPLAPTLLTIWLLPERAWGLWLLLCLWCETQNESDSTTRALQGHFPTGRSWGVKSHHFSPEAVGSGEETNKGNRWFLDRWCVGGRGCAGCMILHVSLCCKMLLKRYLNPDCFIISESGSFYSSSSSSTQRKWQKIVGAWGIHLHRLQLLASGTLKNVATEVREIDHNHLCTIPDSEACRENRLQPITFPADQMMVCSLYSVVVLYNFTIIFCSSFNFFSWHRKYILCWSFLMTKLVLSGLKVRLEAWRPVSGSWESSTQMEDSYRDLESVSAQFK